MRRSAAAHTVFLLVLCSAAWAAERPVAVSPGSATGTLIGDACPTFNWGSVDGAKSYELVVYRIGEESEEAEPVLRETFAGSVSGWTPSLDRCLERGERYAWTVRAGGGSAGADWSEASLFEILAAPSVREVEEALALLKRYMEAADNGPEPGTQRPVDAGGEFAGTAPAKTTRTDSMPLPSQSAGSVGTTVPPPATVTSTGTYALSIDDDFKLGGYIFKEGFPFLHNDGGMVFGNTALGLRALTSSTPGSPEALSGSLNTALGQNALKSNTTGHGNLAAGFNALLFNEDGNSNVGLGFDALRISKTNFNVAVGESALKYTITGHSNTAIGTRVLNKNTSSRNTAVGAFAAYGNTSGAYNTAIGFKALSANTTGSKNTATGAYALRKTDATRNVGIGYKALHDNTSGFRNVAVGSYALDANVDGNRNAALGDYALSANSGGDRNVAVGPSALGNNSNGLRNTGIGNKAGFNATTGDDNIFINNEGLAGDAQTIKIGVQGTQTDTFIAGILGTTDPASHYVHVGPLGQLVQGAVVASSRRFKTDIDDMGGLSAGLKDLRPVTFRFTAALGSHDPGLQFGLIAEEVAEVFPDLVRYDGEGRAHSVKTLSLSALLLNEFQKQRRRIQVQGWLLGVMILGWVRVAVGRWRLA